MSRIRLLFRTYRVESWLVLGGLFVSLVFAIVQEIVLSAPGRANLVPSLGLPLDDVYIHLRYAQNLVHGFGYSFNPPEVISADTSPLWVVLIAIGGVFAFHLEVVAITLSLLSYLIIAPGVYRTARDLLHVSESHAQLAGWAAVLSSRLAWSAMSGMDTALGVLLMLLAVESHLRAYQRRCINAKEALWLGLGILVRPEFVLVAALLIGHWIYVRLREDIDSSHWLPATLLLACVAAPALLLPLATEGTVVSHSATVQAVSANVSFFGYLLFTAKTLAEPNIALLLLAAASLLLFSRRMDVALLSTLLIAIVVAQAFFAPQTRHHGRYLFPLFPPIVLLGAIAWEHFSPRAPRRGANVIPALVIAFGILSTARWSYLSASDVRNINDQHLAATHWLRDNLRTSDTIAAGDVGAIGYLTGRRILDPTGLITPAAWQARLNPDSLWRVLRGQGANLFVIYPRWNRAFFARYHDSLEPQASFTVRLPLTAAADTTLAIYRLRPQHGS